MSVSIALMRSHVRPLCEANRIAINYDRHASASYRDPLRHFGWREYLFHSGWVFGVPMLVFLIGSATYAALQWIATGDDQGSE